MLRFALGYARFGIRVFPIYPIVNGGCGCGRMKCNSKGKHPMIPAWQDNATTNEDDIRYWWKERSDANIGLATGEKSGIWVLDIDGDEGIESIQGHYLPRTLCWNTGGGGIHLVFKWVNGMRNHVGIMPSVDVRGEGGYVLAPPSNHISGRIYDFILNAPIANAPDWLMQTIEQERKVSNGVVFPTGKKFIIENGRRNNTLFHFGLQVRKEFPWLSEDTLKEVLDSINKHHNENPLDDREIRMIAKSVLKYTGGRDD